MFQRNEPSHFPRSFLCQIHRPPQPPKCQPRLGFWNAGEDDRDKVLSGPALTVVIVQVAIEDDLKDCREVSFQAALLYTSSKGERRIRVHTLCVPTTASLQEVIQGADQQCIVGLLAKMAVDRTLNSNLADAREAFINVCVDTIER